MSWDLIQGWGPGSGAGAENFKVRHFRYVGVGAEAGAENFEMTGAKPELQLIIANRA